MANYDFVIYREGLTAKIVGDPVLGAQSEGVRVKIETDGSYPSDKYGTYLYYKFIDNSGIEHNNVAESTFDDTTRITTYYIPVQAFARPGEVMLSIELGNWSSGDANRIVTNPVYLVVKPSAKVYDPKSLPPGSSWQTMVTNYVSVKTSEIENEIRDFRSVENGPAVDPNTLLTPGVRTGIGSANAPEKRNIWFTYITLPVGAIKDGNTEYNGQIAVSIDGDIYVRNRTHGVWGSWRILTTADGITNAYVNNAFKPKGAVNSGSFDDLTSPGSYVVGPHVTNRPKNFSAYGFLDVTHYGNKGVSQKLFGIGKPWLAVQRNCDDSTGVWTDWYGQGLPSNEPFSTSYGAFSENALNALVESIPGGSSRAQTSSGFVFFNGQGWSYLFNFANTNYYSFLFFNYSGRVHISTYYNGKWSDYPIAKESSINEINENLAKSLQSRYGFSGSNSNGIDIVVNATGDGNRRFVWIDWDGIATFTLSDDKKYSSITNIVGSCKITLSYNSTSNALVIHYTAQYRTYLLISSGPLTISS